MIMMKTLIQVPDAAVINMKANFVLPEVKDINLTYFLIILMHNGFFTFTFSFLLFHFHLFTFAIAGGGGFLFNGRLHRARPARDGHDCVPGMKKKNLERF